MPFSRPTLAELVAQAEAEVRSRMGVGPLLDRSFFRVISRVEAGLTHGTYGFLDFLSRQLVPSTRELEFLTDYADLWNIQRKAATFAAGTIRFVGTNGSTIPAGTAVRRTEGAEYSTDALATVAAGIADVAVTAVASGNASDAVATTELVLVSPVAGVDATAVVQAPGLSGGADEETDAALFVRLRQRIQEPPQGSAAADYVAVALGVSEVTRAFALSAHLGLGTVGVTFLVDDDPLGPVPDSAKVAEVQAAIDAFRPVTAAATVFAPLTQAQVFTIQVTPNTVPVQGAVTASIEDLLLRDVVPGGTLLRSRIIEAIATSEGEDDHALLVPAGDVATPAGTILVSGGITFS